MSSIKYALQQCDEQTKTLGLLLIEFYENMKLLENDIEKGGKQAVLIIMSINDIKILNK
jgi:hypothetical protein